MRAVRIHDMIGAHRAVVLLSMMLLSSGCFTPFWENEDASPEFFALFGLPSSGRIGTTHDYEGAGTVPFDGCFLVDVADSSNKGRVVADGFLDPMSRIVVRLEEFRDADRTKGGGIGVDLPAAGQLPTGTQVLPSVPTVVAGWGNATIGLNGVYLDDAFSGEYNFTSHFLVTNDGFTDDDTGRISARDGGPFSPQDPADVATRSGDWEAHLVVHSHTTGEFETNLVYVNRDDGAGRILSDDRYSAEELFVVGWLGGEARFRIEVNGTTLVETAQTSLTFRFFDPSGIELANTTIAPSGSTPVAVAEEIRFPTQRLGTYSFTVEGPAHFASYRVTGTLQAPESYQLHLLWEDRVQQDAVRAFDQCVRSKLRGDPVTGSTNVARPPGLDVRVLVFGVLGALTAGLLILKLVLDSRKIDEFRAKFGKK